GDQPNVVPRNAAVWYYFRETDYPRVKELWEIGDKMAQGASLMTNTTFTSRVLGSAWSGHFNRPIAEDMYENIKRVGLPTWTEDDQKLARAVQKELKVAQEGLSVKLAVMRDASQPGREGESNAGSGDIGDVFWVGPTVTLRDAANIPNLPGRHSANASSMARPIAHKGTLAGTKVQAMTMLDILTNPDLVKRAWDYFRDVQSKDTKYTPLIRPSDQPATFLNRKIMAEYRPRMKQFYYDPSKFN